MGRQSTHDEIYTHEFDSLLGLSKYLDDNWDQWLNSNQPGGSFTECMTHSECREILRHGGHWEAGAARMLSARIEPAKFPMRESALPMPINVVVGHRPNVGAFLAGAPASMVRNTEVAMADRRCRMLVCVNASCSIKHDTLLNRGAAIMGAVENLQNEGYAVELTVGFLTASSEGEAHLLVKIKDYQDTFNPAALAFVLAEPSFFRRSLFAMYEIDSMMQPDNEILQSMRMNLGYPVSKLDKMDYEIVFEPLHGRERWTPSNSADKAMEKVYDWVERNREGPA